MVYHFYIFAFLIFIDGCSSNLPTLNREKVEVKTNGVISQRQYYNNHQSLTGFASFQKEGLTLSEPIDSVSYHLSSKQELDSVLYFIYEKGKYIANSDEPVLKFYETFFLNIKGCIEFKGIADSYLLLDAKNDICSIMGSVLSNGKEVSTLRRENLNLKGGGKTISYDSLNSVFLGLSEDIESNFYQQKMKCLKFVVKNNYLIEECYYFSIGKFTREYTYSTSGKLTSIKSEVKRNDIAEIATTLKIYNYFP